MHFALPDTEIGDSRFGQISSITGDTREMQFALKLYFYACSMENNINDCAFRL